MKTKKTIIRFCIIIPLLALIVAAIFPMTYGGASPMARFLRLDDGGNFGQALLDSAAIAIGKKSGIFDITQNGQNGVYIYSIDDKNNTIETYKTVGEGHTQTASYILIKDGIKYTFSMDADGWTFEDSRECKTDIRRLLTNIASALTQQDVNTTELDEDLSGLAGIALSEYFDFTIVPTCLRSVIRNMNEEDFKIVSGYSYALEDLTLQYSFSPDDSKAFADYANSLLQIAYTKKMRNIMNIAGIAGDVADFFGFDMYGVLFEADFSCSIGALTGKLKGLSIVTDDMNLTATLRKYGNCSISIDSPALEALIIKHVG